MTGIEPEAIAPIEFGPAQAIEIFPSLGQMVLHVHTIDALLQRHGFLVQWKQIGTSMHGRLLDRFGNVIESGEFRNVDATSENDGEEKDD